jgi:GT2 family glycosyltransferase
MSEESSQKDCGRAKVALIVLNHNGKDLLLDCLGHLQAVDYDATCTVVVDNGSVDGSAKAVESQYPQVHLVRSASNTGVAGGRNIGIRWVRAHLNAVYVIFLDNDTRVEPGAVRELLAAASQDPKIGMVAPKAFRRKGDRVLLSAGGMHFNPYTGTLRDVASGEPDHGQHERSRDVQACPGFAFLVRPDVFDRIGLFDEIFNPYGWEDVDFSLRAARAGFRIVYAPKAVVYHSGGREGRGIVRLYEKNKARNMFYFVRRHTTTLQWLCFLSLLPVRIVLRALREVARGHSGVLLAWLSGFRKR